MTEPKKPYSEELKETFQGIFLWLAIGLVVWGIAALFGIGDDNKPNVRRQPTSEDYKRWYKEYQEHGNTDPNIDISQQYGGR